MNGRLSGLANDPGRQPSLGTPGSIYDDEQKKRRAIRDEGKKWASYVNPENAWDKLVLTLGMLIPLHIHILSQAPLDI